MVRALSYQFSHDTSPEAGLPAGLLPDDGPLYERWPESAIGPNRPVLRLQKLKREYFQEIVKNSPGIYGISQTTIGRQSSSSCSSALGVYPRLAALASFLAFAWV